MRTKFGEWVEQWTRETGISQNELARRLGISPIVFCKYCTGDRKISDKTLCKIAEEMRLDKTEKKELFSTAVTEYELKIIEKAFRKERGVTAVDIAIELRFGELGEL